MVLFNVPLECTVNTWKKAILEIKVFSGNLILSVARRSYTPSNFGFSYELAGWYTCNGATKYYWNFWDFFFRISFNKRTKLTRIKRSHPKHIVNVKQNINRKKYTAFQLPFASVVGICSAVAIAVATLPADRFISAQKFNIQIFNKHQECCALRSLFITKCREAIKVNDKWIPISYNVHSLTLLWTIEIWYFHRVTVSNAVCCSRWVWLMTSA